MSIVKKFSRRNGSCLQLNNSERGVKNSIVCAIPFTFFPVVRTDENEVYTRMCHSIFLFPGFLSLVNAWALEDGRDILKVSILISKNVIQMGW